MAGNADTRLWQNQMRTWRGTRTHGCGKTRCGRGAGAWGKDAFMAGRIAVCAGCRRAHGADVDVTQCRRPGRVTAPARTAAPCNHHACLSYQNIGSCVWDVRFPVRSETSTDGRDACSDPPHVHRSLCRPAWTADGPACRWGRHLPLSGTCMPAALPGVMLPPRPVRGRAWLWSDTWKKPPYPAPPGGGGNPHNCRRAAGIRSLYAARIQKHPDPRQLPAPQTPNVN